MIGTTHPSVLIVGTGAFATGLCQALATAPARPTAVHVLGRTLSSSEAVCAAGTARAAGEGTRVRFRALAADFAADDDLRPLLENLAPGITVVCASHQSPRELWHGSTEWSALVRRAGFAVTIPLQAELATRVAAACANTGTSLLNACFPDAVNPILRARGLPVLGGLGNVGTLAEAVRNTLGITEVSRLKLIAHHAHLHRPADPGLDACCWLDDQPLGNIGELLGPIRAATRPDMNAFGAATAGRVVRSLLDDGGYVGHLPGPAGLPGGYPVTVSGRSVSLRLPRGTTEEEALDRTALTSTLDGGSVDAAGTLRLTERAAAELRRHWPDWPGALRTDALDEVFHRQFELRDRLRRIDAAA